MGLCSLCSTRRFCSTNVMPEWQAAFCCTPGEVRSSPKAGRVIAIGKRASGLNPTAERGCQFDPCQVDSIPSNALVLSGATPGPCQIDLPGVFNVTLCEGNSASVRAAPVFAPSSPGGAFFCSFQRSLCQTRIRTVDRMTTRMAIRSADRSAIAPPHDPACQNYGPPRPPPAPIYTPRPGRQSTPAPQYHRAVQAGAA